MIDTIGDTIVVDNPQNPSIIIDQTSGLIIPGLTLERDIENATKMANQT
jgi:hypothetical protein